MIPDKLHILLSDSSSQDSRLDILIELLGFYLRILLDGILLEEDIGFVQVLHGVGESAVDVEGYQLDLLFLERKINSLPAQTVSEQT